MKNIHFSLLMIIFLFACSGPGEKSQSQELDYPPNASLQVKLSSEIEWEQLNPARGDQSPQAGTIWGNRKGEVATGFLAKFVDGFSSPPHIHNVTYRAMVLKGLIHNDDPNAEKMWMPAGSFWTQPAGEAHITAAKGEEVIAYVEIDSGPYLVKPTTEAFDNGERPINVDKNNLIWLNASQTHLIEEKESNNGAAIAFLWEDKEMAGYLLKLPASFSGTILSDGEIFYGIMIQGAVSYVMPSPEDPKSLDPGSYFTCEGKAKHVISTMNNQEVLLYIRTNGEISIQ